MSKDLFAGICKRCKRRKDCTTPCAPVELEVKPTSYGRVFERRRNIGRPDEYIAVFPQYKEIQFANLYDPNAEDTSLEIDFDAEKAKEIWHVPHMRKQTGIFIDRIFNKMSIEDLCVKYSCGESMVRTKLQRAQTRVVELLLEMDKGRVVRKCLGKNQIGYLSLAAKSFLLSTIFEMTNAEIARILESTRSTVEQGIARVKAKVMDGESPFQFEGEECRFKYLTPRQQQSRSLAKRNRERMAKGREAKAA